jgi:quercetin dioxygenase-like cupin family protein
MNSFDLMKDIEFKTGHPVAESVLADKDTRLVRFSLLPGQSIKEHRAPSSPVYIIILEGKGLFSDGHDGMKEFGKNACIKYERGEKHSIETADENLVFVALLKGSPRNTNG